MQGFYLTITLGSISRESHITAAVIAAHSVKASAIDVAVIQRTVQTLVDIWGSKQHVITFSTKSQNNISLLVQLRPFASNS